MSSASSPALDGIDIESLLGSRPRHDEPEFGVDFVRGQSVLVTGAGGSIGSELCTQLMRFDPAEVVMLDRDETALQRVQVAVAGHGLLDTRDVVLADIRDAETIRQVMLDRRPDVVFHAAALKHLPMLEQYPDEGWKTNVLGTRNVLAAAAEAGVGTLVNISTDKAANPTSVLGATKRTAERLTAWTAAATGRAYVSVRFGNVLGSRGSMLPLFADLIRAGRPVTVTHPDATRYFMSIPEACHLVIQATAIAQPGEVLVLDMGQPVRILDIARRMVSAMGGTSDIVFSGLRPGEKLHEDLIGCDETERRPVHPKISHASVPPLAPSALDAPPLLLAA
ncbi:MULTISPECIES: UDP-N-acetylglucosamine 4,6-dehydratase family protein [unclassified Curtobacterium]|uniref:UDP-N-acetylglucosamine 4,6-dehydratase family protein n=1 Tax=unclassified Curtobacterium TaxID=257496 RepID=UPI00381B475D